MNLKEKNAMLEGAVDSLLMETGSRDFLRQSGVDFDADQERLFDVITLVAQNDGAAYRKKDPAAAVKKASREHQMAAARDLRYDLKKIGPTVEAYLKARWSRDWR